MAKAELVKLKMKNYRIDYAFEVLKAKQHTCKKEGYQLRQDEKSLWQLIKDNPREVVNENV